MQIGSLLLRNVRWWMLQRESDFTCWGHIAFNKRHKIPTDRCEMDKHVQTSDVTSFEICMFSPANARTLKRTDSPRWDLFCTFRTTERWLPVSAWDSATSPDFATAKPATKQYTWDTFLNQHSVCTRRLFFGNNATFAICVS